MVSQVEMSQVEMSQVEMSHMVMSQVVVSQMVMSQVIVSQLVMSQMVVSQVVTSQVVTSQVVTSRVVVSRVVVSQVVVSQMLQNLLTARRRLKRVHWCCQKIAPANILSILDHCMLIVDSSSLMLHSKQHVKLPDLKYAKGIKWWQGSAVTFAVC